MAGAGAGVERLLDWLKRQGRLRVFPAEGAPMVARIGARRVVYRDTEDAGEILAAGWSERELGELAAEMERDP